MKKLLLITTLVLLSMPLFTGCKKTENTPPVLPPYQSMAIDFSSFKVQSTSGIDIQKSFNEVNTIQNWAFAYGTVVFWNTLLTFNLAVPVAAFYASFNQKAIYLGDAKWEWKYDITISDVNYSARLTGEFRENGIKWEMYISRSGPNSFPEFKWFEGTSSLNGKGGQWILYQSYLYQVPFLQIDWSATNNQIDGVKYSYIRELDINGNPNSFNGSYLIYGLQDNYFNAFYTVHIWDTNTEQFMDTYIEWNTTEYYGHVKSQNKFQDLNWHCWDNLGNDIDCTN